MINLHRFAPAALLTICTLGPTIVCPGATFADESEETDGPWISSLTWTSDGALVGTKSQGLLLRPAELVKAQANKPDELSSLAEAETSLWSVLSLEDGTFITTDYRGGVHHVSDSGATKLDVECRWVRASALAPSGELVVGTEDGQLVVISLGDKKELKKAAAHQAAVFDIQFNSAGDTVATAGGDGHLKLFSWPALEPVANMTRGSEAVWSISFCEDGKHLVSGGADRRLQLWDLETQSSICTITRTSDWITETVAIPDSNLILASCMDGKLVVVDSAAILKVAEVEAAGSAIWSIALSADANSVAMGTRKSGIQLMEIPDWKSQAKAAAEKAVATRPPSPK